jgi:hypothetical protein
MSLAYCLSASMGAIVGNVVPSNRTITINVQLRKENGEAIAGVPIRAMLRGNGALSKTNASGDVSLVGEVDTSATSCLVCLTAKSPEQGVLDQLNDRDRFDEVTTQSAFRQYYKVALIATEDTYLVQIVGYPAITVSGRFVDQAGGPLDCEVTRLDSPTSLDADTDGLFSVGGVRRSTATELLCQSPNDGSYKAVQLSASQTLADIQLGDVVIPPLGGTVSIQVTMTNRDNLVRNLSAKRAFVSFVSSDGQVIAEYPLDSDGLAKPWAEETGLPQLPPGTYYVVPGPVQPNRTGAKLIGLIRSHRQIELDAAGAVKLIASTGSTTVLTFDAVAAETAILTVAGDD